MYEKIELERIKLETSRTKTENRFRCLELASRFSSDNETTLKDAKKYLDFIKED